MLSPSPADEDRPRLRRRVVETLAKLPNLVRTQWHTDEDVLPPDKLGDVDILERANLVGLLCNTGNPVLQAAASCAA
jgi:hypothetical protein